MNAYEEIDRLLKQDGAILKRQRKHKVYGLSNGKNFVMSATPSDKKAGNSEKEGEECAKDSKKPM